MILHRYQITLLAEEQGELPYFIGNTIRGSFGQALKQQNPKLYALFFEKTVAKDSEIYKIVKNAPPAPYTIYTNRVNNKIAKGDEIKFILTLFGNYQQYINELYPVFETMANNKIGENALKFQFTELKKLQCNHSQQLAHNFNDYNNLKLTSNTFTLKFQSPVILEKNKQLITDFDFQKVFNYLNQRMYVLDTIYGDNTFKEIALQDHISLHKINVQKTIIKRKPTAGKLQTKISWIGSIEYYTKESRSELLQLLYFGQYMQIGSGTSFGYGKYKLIF